MTSNSHHTICCATYAALPTPREVQVGNRVSSKMAHARNYDALDPSLAVEEEMVRGYKAEH